MASSTEKREKSLQLLASTIVLFCIYSTLGVGFITIYKASRVLNFAYADLALLIGYLAVTLTSAMGSPVIIPLALTVFCSFIIGLIIYRMLIRSMVGESLLATIILTVALGIIINAIVILIWGGNIETISLGWKGYYRLPGGARLSATEIISIIYAGLLFSALGAFYQFSKIGRQMRASAENFLLSAQRGLNIYFMTALAWGIGTFVTGSAGILVGAISGVSLKMGTLTIKGLAVALVGGLDSLKGAIPAALIIALTEKLVSYYVNPRLGDTVPFLIMLIVLLIRPWGLWGTEEEIERV
jgi:branched-chain amino acid transport system permease protein